MCVLIKFLNVDSTAYHWNSCKIPNKLVLWQKSIVPVLLFQLQLLGNLVISNRIKWCWERDTLCSSCLGRLIVQNIIYSYPTSHQKRVFFIGIWWKKSISSKKGNSLSKGLILILNYWCKNFHQWKVHEVESAKSCKQHKLLYGQNFSLVKLKYVTFIRTIND